MRKLSCVAPEWWDYTTLDADIVNDAARLTPQDLQQLSRPGFRVVMYDTIEEFYLAEALEYIEAWKQSTPDNPAGDLRSHWSHRAIAVGGASGQRHGPEPRPAGRAFLGHGRVGAGRPGRGHGPSVVVRQGRHGTVLPSDS